MTSERVCPEAARRLYEFWFLFWNGPGDADYGDHVGYTYDQMNELDKAAARIEDHYAEHKCNETDSYT